VDGVDAAARMSHWDREKSGRTDWKSCTL